jgi:predicted NBD/HSP70 family sugar kinase
LISEPVIIHQAEMLAMREPQGLLAKSLQRKDSGNVIEHIFTAARNGDQPTKGMIEERACYLGIALATLVNLLNPELILLGGMFAQGVDLILPKASDTMRKLAFGNLGEKVRVETTSFGWRAGVIGAAALALTNYIYQQQAPLQDIHLS